MRAHARRREAGKPPRSATSRIVARGCRQCVFTDGNKIATGDEAPFQALILTENATENVKFTSMNNLAKKYTIRIRQAR
jgi:hypothetical protein